MFLTVFAIAAAGCSMPNWRVGQEKVDPKKIDKTASQLDAEKRAASYIKLRTEPPVPDPKAAVQDVHQVAVGLSSSLGEPRVEVTLEDRDRVVSELRQALVEKDRQIEAWRSWARKYAGTPLEGTGIDLAGPAGLLAFAGVIAACILVPGFGYLVLRIVPALWGLVKRTAVGIESFAADHASEGELLKQGYLGRKMDTRDKKIIRRSVKPKIRPEELVTGTRAPFPIS